MVWTVETKMFLNITHTKRFSVSQTGTFQTAQTGIFSGAETETLEADLQNRTYAIPHLNIYRKITTYVSNYFISHFPGGAERLIWFQLWTNTSFSFFGLHHSIINLHMLKHPILVWNEKLPSSAYVYVWNIFRSIKRRIRLKRGACINFRF